MPGERNGPRILFDTDPEADSLYSQLRADLYALKPTEEMTGLMSFYRNAEAQGGHLADATGDQPTSGRQNQCLLQILLLYQHFTHLSSLNATALPEENPLFLSFLKQLY